MPLINNVCIDSCFSAVRSAMVPVNKLPRGFKKYDDTDNVTDWNKQYRRSYDVYFFFTLDNFNGSDTWCLFGSYKGDDVAVKVASNCATYGDIH